MHNSRKQRTLLAIRMKGASDPIEARPGSDRQAGDGGAGVGPLVATRQTPL